MVKDIKYIWYGMTFTELREILRLNKKLRGFPLVDSPTQMVLLGSVQRTELITAIEKHIGKEKYDNLSINHAYNAQDNFHESPKL